MANNDSTTILYKGKYKAVFSNSAHRYYINGSLKPGVTTMINQTIAKPDLMTWPLNMALKFLREHLGEILTESDLIEAYKAHLKRQTAGADTGTIVHGLVENILRTGDDTLSYADQAKEVQLAMSAFHAWYAVEKPEVLAIEQVLYSESYDYCGTLDSVFRLSDGKVYLCDLKTTNASRSAPDGVYAENFIQLGFYLLAYEEQAKYDTEMPGIDALMILSCRKDGKLTAKTNEDLHITLEECKRMARSTWRLYTLLRKLKKEIGGK